MKYDTSQIVIDDAIYPRKEISEFGVTRLIQALLTGAKLPPIIVEASTLRLVDGRHRLLAHQRLDIKQIEVKEKTYATDADLFADAVRLNTGHGEPLDSYSIKNAIIKLEDYGYSKEKISEVVRLPVARIEKMERGFAVNEAGKPLAVKGGLSHLHGALLTPEQQAINRKYSGGKAIFHLKQLNQLLENDMYPQTALFATEMDRLVLLWTKISHEKKSA
jgi:ParB-like chromosome segregation protein Spo0J